VIRGSLAVLPLALAIGVTGAGCGSDSSGETTVPSVSIPSITSPVPTTSSTSITTDIPSTSTTNGGKSFNPAEPDSETNDIPPAKGSPEEAFEKQCKAQGTCG